MLVGMIREEFDIRETLEPISPAIAAKFTKNLIEPLGKQEALLNREQAMRVGFKKANLRAPFGIPPDFKLHLIAVAARLRRVHGDRALPVDLPGATQGFKQNISLYFSLALRLQMLVITTPAPSKIGTGGLDAFRRSIQDSERPGMHDAFGDAHCFHLGALAGKDARNKHCPAFVMAERIPAVNELLRNDFESHRSMIRQR